MIDLNDMSRNTSSGITTIDVCLMSKRFNSFSFSLSSALKYSNYLIILNSWLFASQIKFSLLFIIGGSVGITRSQIDVWLAQTAPFIWFINSVLFCKSHINGVILSQFNGFPKTSRIFCGLLIRNALNVFSLMYCNGFSAIMR